MCKLPEPIARVILLAASITLSALAAEGITRTLAPRVLSLSSEQMRFDPEIGWVQRAGRTLTARNEAQEEVVVEGNALGIRQPPEGYRTAGVENVLAVGDSFTAGTQLPYAKAWPALLERQLSVARPHIQVVNSGMDGYDLVQEYHLAQRLWRDVQPHHVIVAVYVGNDLLDYEHASFARPPWHPLTARAWLREHSYFYHLLSGATRKWRESIAAPVSRRGRAEDVRPQKAAADLLPVLQGGEEGRRRLRSTERVLKAFAALATTHCAGFTVVFLPTKEHVVPAEREKWMRMNGLSAAQLDFPETVLGNWAQAEGISYVDAVQELAKYPVAERLFWQRDIHMSEEGHAMVARAIANSLLVRLHEFPACVFPPS